MVTLNDGVGGPGASPERREHRESTRPSSSATVTRIASVARACSRRSPTSRRVIGPELIGFDVMDQAALDAKLCELDGTPNKAHLGANAILAVSLACEPCGGCGERDARSTGISAARARIVLPVPQFNVLNGGAHAQTRVDFQEFMLLPIGLPTFAEALRAGAECFHALAHRSSTTAASAPDRATRAGTPRTSTTTRPPWSCCMEAIGAAGYAPGRDVAIGLDPATSELYKDGHYELRGEGITLDASRLVDRWEEWVDKYPIVSLEDGMAEDDWDGLEASDRSPRRARAAGGGRHLRHQHASACSSDSTAASPIPSSSSSTRSAPSPRRSTRSRLPLRTTTARVISHRSGETEDTSIADLAVAVNAGQIKTGAPSRSERVAKYNRLLRIEHELGECSRVRGHRCRSSAPVPHPA